MAVIWLSFPNLPPNFYVPSILFSIASAVGRPIAIDAATLNKTRPSCARVKVEADLLQEHPQRYNIQIMNGEEMETMSYKIRYDFLPKYCTTCMLQGHDLQGCWKEHRNCNRKRGITVKIQWWRRQKERRFSATHYPSPSRLSMAIPATGRPPPEVGHHPPIPAHPLNYSNVLKSSPTIPFLSSPETAINGGTSSPCGNASPMSSSIPIKPIVYLHGEPTVRFEKKEVEVMIHQQNLNLAVIGKFSHGWPEIGLLRTAIPKQCGLKAEVNIGLLCDRHVLIRCTIAEDYDTLMSRQTFEIKEKNKPYLMRTFKWDVTFNPDEETRFAYGWISFPGLPPHFHGESSLFSMAASVGIPISIDSATRNKTRPSSARVKVEVDLLKVHPKSVLIQVGEGAEITSTQQRIRYDFLPKYCTNCKLQGHDSIGCWKLHPELRPHKADPTVAGGLTAAGGEKSKSHHPTHPPLSSTSHPTNSEWQTVNHRRKTTGKGNPNPPQNTKNPSNSLENPIPAAGTVNTTSQAVGNTVQATENTILQKNTFFEIFGAGNPTGILGGAGNPTGTLGGAGDPTGTLPAPSPVQAAHPPETLAAVERRFFGHPTFQSFRPIPAILAVTATGWPPPEVTQLPATVPPPVTYSNIVTNTHNVGGGNGLAENSLGRNPSPSIPQKPISYLHGEPTIRFTNQEVASMVEQQDLKYAVVGKFSHGMPSIAFLRTAIPKQCSLKAEVNIGLLHNRHVLIRCSIEEDYVTLMSRPNFWIKENSKSFLMRTFKWDIGFTPEEETSMAVIWLSFPNLPPNFYVPSILFSIASAVGRPIAIDAATLNKTRPSCARVKVEADLLQEHPQRYNIQIMNGEEMETMSYKIRYDFLPKYCTTCMLQGHDLQGCWKEHPELQPEKRNHGEDSVVAAAKGKAPNPTLPSTNPSRQNPNPKPLPTAPNPPQEWTTVTHKRKKQNHQKQPLDLMENTTPVTETTPQVALDVGNIASSSKQPILTQILTEIGIRVDRNE
ncbi:hypothetical protein RND71_040235 [Anisodus tanguticus]|uniref:DUF4283 domain-containing protein n=1 Tax=Anisodus tanguticus TaxID=243964 RepID=A0AAE1QSF9_9SOLA|nr:hypothetical protein RND71_040235 [Anisodus tanguticus]